VHKFERWARQRLAEGFSLDQAVAELATSKRALLRRKLSRGVREIRRGL
jgi:hypothetical protein